MQSVIRRFEVGTINSAFETVEEFVWNEFCVFLFICRNFSVTFIVLYMVMKFLKTSITKFICCNLTKTSAGRPFSLSIFIPKWLYHISTKALKISPKFEPVDFWIYLYLDQCINWDIDREDTVINYHLSQCMKTWIHYTFMSYGILYNV